jgi:hypothetical protein
VLGWLRQGVLLALWALVGWGTLLLVASVAGALRDGPAVALGRLLPGPRDGLWGWLNGASAVLAVVGWLVLAGLLALNRTGRDEDAEPGASEDEPPDPDRLPDEPT